MLPESKDKLRTYVNALRNCLEKSNMIASKRKNLLDKLDAFEQELEKRRMNIGAVTLIAFEILGIPGATWASADIVHKLVSNVMQTVAESKVGEQDTKQLVLPPNTRVLIPPRQAEKKPVDLDDEIPF